MARITKKKKNYDAQSFFHKFHICPYKLYILCDLLIMGNLDVIKVWEQMIKGRVVFEMELEPTREEIFEQD